MLELVVKKYRNVSGWKAVDWCLLMCRSQNTSRPQPRGLHARGCWAYGLCRGPAKPHIICPITLCQDTQFTKICVDIYQCQILIQTDNTHTQNQGALWIEHRRFMRSQINKLGNRFSADCSNNSSWIETSIAKMSFTNTHSCREMEKLWPPSGCCCHQKLKLRMESETPCWNLCHFGLRALQHCITTHFLGKLPWDLHKKNQQKGSSYHAIRKLSLMAIMDLDAAESECSIGLCCLCKRWSPHWDLPLHTRHSIILPGFFPYGKGAKVWSRAAWVYIF